MSVLDVGVFEYILHSCTNHNNMLTERHLRLSLVYLLWLLASWRLLTWSPSHCGNPQGLSYLPHTALHNTHRQQLIQWTFDRQSHLLPRRCDSRLMLLIRSGIFFLFIISQRVSSRHLGQIFFMYRFSFCTKAVLFCDVLSCITSKSFKLLLNTWKISMCAFCCDFKYFAVCCSH